jgi:hypothetical protein
MQTLPLIIPPDGAPVASEAPVIPDPPIVVLQPALLEPPAPFDPEATDNLILRLQIAPALEILEASVRLQGDSHQANLVNHARISVDNNLAEIGFGELRPLTRIGFTPVAGAHRLMIRLGGAWIQPDGPASVNFANYSSNTRFPELVTEGVLLDNVAAVTNIESISFPANVVLRLTDGGAPFFFHRGELRTAGVQTPDFGQQLALALQGCEPVNGRCTIDLIAHSDAFGTITATQPRVVYRFVHNSLDGLDFAARSVLIPAGGGATFLLPLRQNLANTPASPNEGTSGVQPPVAAVTLRLVPIGLGPVFATGARRGAIVSAQFQVAQAVVFGQPFTVAALYLYLLRRTPKAGLTMELRGDVDGEPRGAVLATAPVGVSGLAENTFAWAAATLGEPVTLEANTPIWIVLKAGEGEVEWRGGDIPTGGPAALFSTDQGNTWQSHPLTASYVFQQLLPDPATALTLRIEAGGEQQEIIYAPENFPLSLGPDSALVRGINAAIAQSGAPPPSSVGLTLRSDSALPVQVTLTQFDIAYTQVHTV